MLGVSLNSILLGQVNWVKYENNPIINVGTTGSWDSRASGPTSVIYHNGIYEAWLYGTDNTGRGQIGYATSIDGIEWTKYQNNPVVVPGSQGQWDDTNTDHACVLFMDGLYKMWYMGEDGSSARIGYATSTGDGTEEDAKYFRIGYATSPDGKIWSKFEHSPVLDIGAAGSWDSLGVVASAAMYDTTLKIYKMWYGGLDGSNGRTGYATSDPVSNLHYESAKIISQYFELHQNYPNPFNPNTIITFTISISKDIKLAVYDILGNEVTVLLDGFKNKGTYSVPFSADDLSSGIYFYTLQIGGKKIISKKMLLVK